MSGHWEAAVDNVDGILFSENPHRSTGAERQLCENILTAALPHLRRHILAELANQAAEEDAYEAVEWLLAAQEATDD